MTMYFCSMGRVIDALLAIPATNPTIFPPSVVICDGPWTTAIPPDELVTVGFKGTVNPSGDVTAGTMTATNMGIPLRMFEQYDVPCSIRSRNGDPNAQKASRDRVLAMFSVFEQSLRSDPTLGQALKQQATINTIDLLQDDPDGTDGAVSLLTFTVHVENELPSS